jgi:exonuclease SbcD
MKLLHTADWHLADRIGRIDRTDDLRRAVERIADLCEQERVETLIVAGDLFSDLARPEALHAAIAHFNRVFRPFLTGGGTIVAVTGNHDNETFCRTLQEAFRLASPAPQQTGDLLPAGRLHLATGATFFRLADRQGQQVQFACLPYPTGQRYLDDPRQRFTSLDERHRALKDALEERLKQMQQQLDPRLPSVLIGHFYVSGAATRGLFRLSEQEDVCFGESTLASGWSYVALGHIHQPQPLAGLPHARYSGSIERLDLGERDDDKSAVLLEIGRHGLLSEPTTVPLEATPFYDVHITDPQAELPHLTERYPHAERALTKLHITYRPGEDNLPEILAELDRRFPRWYSRDYRAARSETAGGADFAATLEGEGEAAHRPGATVLRYLEHVIPEDDADRAELFALAHELLQQSPDG